MEMRVEMLVEMLDLDETFFPKSHQSLLPVHDGPINVKRTAIYSSIQLLIMDKS